jgi:tetratricopeptide (TPR) repeat protein
MATRSLLFYYHHLFHAKKIMSPDDVPVSHFDKIFELARQGDFDAAVALARQDYDACMAYFGNRNFKTATAANNLGCVFQMKGDLTSAMAYYENAQAVINKMDDSEEQRKAQIMGLCNMGECLCDLGDGLRAASLLRQAQSIISRTPSIEPILKGFIVSHLGRASVLNNDLETAERLVLEGLVMARDGGLPSLERDSLFILVDIYEKRGDQIAADQLREKIAAIKLQT